MEIFKDFKYLLNAHIYHTDPFTWRFNYVNVKSQQKFLISQNKESGLLCLVEDMMLERS